MENTLENKAKFFAQYWGQDVLFYQCQSWNVFGDFQELLELENTIYLELTPLHLINDEDAKTLSHTLPNIISLQDRINKSIINTVKEIISNYTQVYMLWG